MANEKNEKIHCEDVQNDAPTFFKIRIFGLDNSIILVPFNAYNSGQRK